MPEGQSRPRKRYQHRRRSEGQQGQAKRPAAQQGQNQPPKAQNHNGQQNQAPKAQAQPQRPRQPLPQKVQHKDSYGLKGAFSTLIPAIQHAIFDQGYTAPTPIQAQAIGPLCEGRDMIGCAQTGTGKTAAFSLPILQFLAAGNRPPVRSKPRVLIVAPTRELAAQIDESIGNYGKYLGVKHAVIYGGVGQAPQVAKLKTGLDVLSATPGRLLDLMGQGFISLSDVEFFVLDEADRMLDMGFLPDIKRVIRELPLQRQSLFFSATMEAKVKSLALTLVKNPVTVTISPDTPAVERIGQRLLFVDKGNKDTLLVHLMQNPAFKRVIVFTQMKHQANK
ncbi:hypothetical protein KIPB_008554, partial [Kipferlia bialata]|eukprot:g8554.t1